MKYIALLALIVALATVVLGQSSSVATGDYIYITQPIDTTTYTAGKSASITWKFTAGAGAPSTVQIDLLNNGVLISSIATGVKASSGKYTWAIPATEPSSYYYSIRISDPTTNYQSYSHAFTLKGVGALSSLAAVSTSSYAYSSPSSASSSLATAAILPTNTAAPANASSSVISSSTAAAAAAAARSGASKVGSNALAALSVFVIAIVILA